MAYKKMVLEINMIVELKQIIYDTFPYLQNKLI